MAGAGDLDGDLIPDVAIGGGASHWLETFDVPSDDAGFPATYVIAGAKDILSSGNRSLARQGFQGGFLLRGAGNFLAGGKDIDGDGRTDLIAARRGGGAYVLFGGSARGARTFTRGDANSSGAIDLSDAVTILGYLFLGNASPPCLDAADVDDDATVSLADAIRLLLYLFQGGAPPLPPFPNPGRDTTPGGPGCGGPA